MAAGVPETDVFQAADAVLARGERPTVERVRLELGRGSPARVGQLLERWWERLAQRLKGHALLPELPGEVAQTFAEAWRVALTHASTVAEAALTEQQNAVLAEQMSLTQERKLWETALTAVQTDLAEGASKLAQAELQLVERQGLVDQIATQVADMRQQRDHWQNQFERRQAELDALRAEQFAAQGHIRSAEDRAHQEVDHARQELKAVELQRESERRKYAKQIADVTAERDVLRAAARINEQTAAHQAGRIAALETTINQWQHAPTINPKRARRKATPAPASKSQRPKKKSPP